MVESGTIVAKINEKEGMVSFGEEDEQYNTQDTLRSIHRSLSNCIQLGGMLRNLDDQVASSSEFIQKTQLNEGRPFGGTAGEPEGMQGGLGPWGHEGGGLLG